jgi:hypothetical protein
MRTDNLLVIVLRCHVLLINQKSDSVFRKHSDIWKALISSRARPPSGSRFPLPDLAYKLAGYVGEPSRDFEGAGLKHHRGHTCVVSQVAQPHLLRARDPSCGCKIWKDGVECPSNYEGSYPSRFIQNDRALHFLQLLTQKLL